MKGLPTFQLSSCFIFICLTIDVISDVLSTTQHPSFLADTKRIVLQKLFSLRKLRYYITEKCALSIYKQTILPIFEYSGFLLISCTKSDRYDLQVMENDALWTCFNVKRRDKLSVLNMHVKANLLSLEQRRTQQLLHLMYMHKRMHIDVCGPHGSVVYHVATCVRGPGYDSRSRRHCLQNVNESCLGHTTKSPVNTKIALFIKELNYGNYYH